MRLGRRHHIRPKTVTRPRRAAGGVALAALLLALTACSSSPQHQDHGPPSDLAGDSRDLSQPDTVAWDGGSKQFGEPCSADSECRSRLCLASHICSKACDGNDDCLTGENWRCSDTEQGKRCTCEYRSPKESCNGIDDDCNGEIDDLASCPTSQQCVDGRCQCPTDATLCPGPNTSPPPHPPGICYNLDTNPDHCGTCTRVCPKTPMPPNATRACTKGKCGWTCVTGWGDCDGKPENGCEQELLTQGNCGGCGVVCKNVCAGGECCDFPTITPNCKGGFCTIPPGCFVMGSPKSEPCRLNPYGSHMSNPHTTDWEEQHPVRLTRPFAIGETPVTQGQFQAAMGYNPSFYQSTDPSDIQRFCYTTTGNCSQNPVERLTWHEAAAYCNSLSQKAQLPPCYSCTGSQEGTSCQVATGYERGAIYACPGYRLPTEAEWEYAYRAGTTTTYYNGVNQLAQYCPSGSWDPRITAIRWPDGQPSGPVGTLVPNAWGLHDMAAKLGNWTHHHFAPYPHVPGKPLHDPWPELHFLMKPPFDDLSAARGLRSALRGAVHRTSRSSGVRCVRTLSGTTP